MRYNRFQGSATTTVWILVALFLTTACSNQPSYNFDYDEHTDFSAYKTYRWYDDTHDSKAADYRQYNSSDKRVRTHIDNELQDKGLKPLTIGPGDFWVNYNISRQDQMRVDSFSGYPSAGMHNRVGVGSYGSAVSIGYSSGPNVRVYSEGTVVLDIIDARSSKIVWRGIAEGRLKKSLTHAEKNQRAAEVAKELLADFPPIETGAM